MVQRLLSAPVKYDYMILDDFPESLPSPPPVPEAATPGCCPAWSFPAHSEQVPTTVMGDVSDNPVTLFSAQPVPKLPH